jgi:hypothetical protein
LPVAGKLDEVSVGFGLAGDACSAVPVAESALKKSVLLDEGADPVPGLDETNGAPSSQGMTESQPFAEATNGWWDSAASTAVI